jgi:hypothetical protein
LIFFIRITNIVDLPKFVHVEFVYDEKEFQLWWDIYQKTDGQSDFSLLNRQNFARTHLVYLDNLHKDHYEVFNDQGKHIGIANLKGEIETKREKGRRITI